MKRIRGWVGVGVLAAAPAAGGCATRPYAADPLLRYGRGVWGDEEAARQPAPPAAPGPEIPAPPDGPLAGDPPPAVAVSSP